MAFFCLNEDLYRIRILRVVEIDFFFFKALSSIWHIISLPPILECHLKKARTSSSLPTAESPEWKLAQRSSINSHWINKWVNLPNFRPNLSLCSLLLSITFSSSRISVCLPLAGITEPHSQSCLRGRDKELLTRRRLCGRGSEPGHSGSGARLPPRLPLVVLIQQPFSASSSCSWITGFLTVITCPILEDES